MTITPILNGKSSSERSIHTTCTLKLACGEAIDGGSTDDSRSFPLDVKVTSWDVPESEKSEVAAPLMVGRLWMFRVVQRARGRWI